MHLDNSPKVSIIVAAYNAEKYIRRCLDSLLAQTMNDFELIVVDDGSTDTTADIVDAYATRDTRVRVIHQDNGGVASARQAGMDAARGEYTIHADADDWAEPEMLAELCCTAMEKDADMVICDIWTILPHGEVQYWKQEPYSLSHIDMLGQMMGDLYGSLWNKLIRRDCYLRWKICFQKDVTVCEDQLVLMRILAHPIKVTYLNKAFYHYDQSQNPASFVNKETIVAKRLLPLEIIASETDISLVQSSFDRAIFAIAYHALYVSKEYCPDYSSIFFKHKKSIRRASAPWYLKICVLAQIYHIPLPISAVKRLIHRFL